MTPEKANDAGRTAMEQAGDWCLKLAEGDLSPSERLAFEAWLDADEANEPAFERVAKVWNVFGPASATPEVLQLRTRALANFQEANRRRWTLRQPGLAMKVAASIVIVVLVGISASYWLMARPDIYETNIGERQVAVLEDGSRVSLDADTYLEVALSDERRDITLESGRAKFDVAKDTARPFSVLAGDKRIIATGTSFSVEIIGGEVDVILYEGRVSVVDTAKATVAREQGRPDLADDAEIGMDPGERLVATDEGMQFEPGVDMARSLAWVDGQLTFDRDRLDEVVLRANRYSRRKLELAEPGLGSLPVNGVFNAGDVDALAVGLEATLPVSVTERDGTLVIRRRR